MRMRKSGLIAAFVMVIAGTAIAVAQGGAGNGGAVPAAEQADHVAACAEQERNGGIFGRCVSEEASAFGKCVSEAATAAGNPTEACAALEPGRRGDGGGVKEIEIADAADRGGDTSAADNPTTGLTKPPEQEGREFGQQVAANAGGNPGGAGADQNPTTGVAKPPATDGSEFGDQVSDVAAGGAPGPPAGVSGPPAGAPGH
jgi:hypothetical protein